MIRMSMKLVKRPPSAAEIFKQVRFGTAVGLTRTGVEAQTAVLAALSRNFTIRSKWATPGNRFGINLKRATPQKLSAEVYTRAEWLEKHETGGIKTPRGKNVAVPTVQLRPKGSLKILRAAARPRALLASGKAFIMETDKGSVIAVMSGKDKVKILYGLEPQVRIPKRPSFYEPIEKTVKKRLSVNVDNGIRDAFASAHYKGRWK